MDNILQKLQTITICNIETKKKLIELIKQNMVNIDDDLIKLINNVLSQINNNSYVDYLNEILEKNITEPNTDLLKKNLRELVNLIKTHNISYRRGYYIASSK